MELLTQKVSYEYRVRKTAFARGRAGLSVFRVTRHANLAGVCHIID